MKIIFKAAFIVLLLSNFSEASIADKISNKIGSFAAKIRGGEVELNWMILNPGNLNKFRIESRTSGTESYLTLTDVLFSNFRKKEIKDSVVVYQYTYSDMPKENGVYFYKLSVYDIFNKVVSTEEIKIGITEVPEFKLNQNNPNPFNPNTEITYQLLVPTQVKLMVYSLTGQYIDCLLYTSPSPRDRG
jgi:hypothetical protein